MVTEDISEDASKSPAPSDQDQSDFQGKVTGQSEPQFSSGSLNPALNSTGKHQKLHNSCMLKTLICKFLHNGFP